ncbi:uncharacterized protein METZ01_LOCUS85126 [marine metagenome]|uniref:Uncharacterized protein n=1 Tax=marine metagenome TaxID=408172 RepID=A0A381UVU7_9ZZZZ
MPVLVSNCGADSGVGEGLMLSERAATVLNVLADEYLQSATPVASGEIARSLSQMVHRIQSNSSE